MSKNSSSSNTGLKYRIIYEPTGISSTCSAGSTILANTANLGLALRSDCGGKGRCGQCKVITSDTKYIPPPNSNEQKLLTKLELRRGYRLACSLRPFGDLRITIPETSLDSHGPEIKNNLTSSCEPKPLVMRHIALHTDELITNNQESDLCSCLPTHYIPEDWNSDLSHSALVQLSQLNSASDLTLIAHRHFGITAILPGNQPCSLGVALDVGTTTLAAYLCDFSDGSVLASASAANLQRRFGEDVISRITYTLEHKHGTHIMKELVIKAMNQLINQCLKMVKCSVESIDEICVVGNPTMQHLCLGFNPNTLGSSPYRPITCQSLNVRAESLGLCTRPDINVHVFPIVSGFIGGDTIAAVLAAEIQRRSEITLLIDIGTNGEIVLGNSERLWTTSCATGPALEGAHINCGMRATTGAIDRVIIDPDTYQPTLHIIDETDRVSNPIGVCGSGIIDAVAEMIKTGIVLSSGRLREGCPGVVQDDKGIGREFLLWKSKSKEDSRRIVLSLSDIRQIQLAKAALSTGIQLLMKHSGYERFDRLILTGAFGARFNWKNGILIGMLPEVPPNASVQIIENGAGYGAVKALLNS
ncbi:MAG: DUF4445 domain-containing protein, partial [Anaerolineaceae bacterium]|nr:DUF4445 domain-containing protein [Anaerolineaceae bacterium]